MGIFESFENGNFRFFEKENLTATADAGKLYLRLDETYEFARLSSPSVLIQNPNQFPSTEGCQRKALTGWSKGNDVSCGHDVYKYMMFPYGNDGYAKAYIKPRYSIRAKIC
ncbi:MAG: hypothetical protein LBL00_04955 [Endomicrobium sp.]|jgi:hypothetical protein|nr:hypothetical protein [Endomicrobium sp.]